MQSNIAVVVVGYNRPHSLLRLLNSLASADYGLNTTIPLVISIDYSGNDDCVTLANQFEWRYGTKTIIQRPYNLGLKKHILLCGDLTEVYDAVIVLEDDLFVSPSFYNYAQQAYSFYKNEKQVAGIALYHNIFNEVAYCPFEPLNDGYDIYFMQVPCSWGQLWTKNQWRGFVQFLNAVQDEQLDDALPANVKQWPNNSSWKKYFYSYLLQTGKYFVYPRVGLSTNFGDVGQHLQQSQTVFQTALLLAKKAFQFSTPEQSLSIYDGFYELNGQVYNKLVDANLSVSFDLNGTKQLSSIKTTHLISSKQCNNPQKQFSVACYPYENNVLLNILAKGKEESYFSLAATSSFSEKQQFSRLPIDLKRVFLSDMFLQNAVRAEVELTNEFRLGRVLLAPLRIIKRLAGKQE